MSNKNIQFLKRNFVIVNNYFFTINHESASLLKFNTKGNLVNAFPLTTNISNEVTCLMHDGFNFWSMETDGSDLDDGVIIRKWSLYGNYCCNLIKSINLNTKSYTNFGNILKDTFHDDIIDDNWIIKDGEFEEIDGKLLLREGQVVKIHTYIKTVYNFNLNIDFWCVGNYRGTFNIRLYKNDTEIIDFMIYHNPSYEHYAIQEKGVTIYQKNNVIPINLYTDRVNYIVIKRTDHKTQFIINDYVVFMSESFTDNNINKLGFEFMNPSYYTILGFDKVSIDGDYGNYLFESETFALEYYNTGFKEKTDSGTSRISLSDPLTDIIESGDILILGPNKEGFSEEVTVSGYLGNSIYGLPFFTFYDYDVDDLICIYKHIWLFNNYTTTEHTGALYKIHAETNEIKTWYSGNNFSDISACALAEISDIKQIGTKNCLMYVSAATIKFLDVYNPLNIHCNMLIDNFFGAEIFKVYGLCVSNGTIYRLQLKTSYFGTVYTETTYNYQCSPIRNFVETVLLSVDPLILPNTGVNRAMVRCSSQDQYGYPSEGASALFYENSPTGYMGLNNYHLDIEGNAETFYVSGVEIGTITIGVEILQNDW